MYELITEDTQGNVLSRSPHQRHTDADEAMDQAVRMDQWPGRKPVIIKIEALADVRITTRMHLIE